MAPLRQESKNPPRRGKPKTPLDSMHKYVVKHRTPTRCFSSDKRSIDMCTAHSHMSVMAALLMLLAPGRALTNWHVSKSQTHDALLSLVRDVLVFGPRRLPETCVHLESVVRTLPHGYGLPSSAPGGLLTPDLVAADHSRGELLIVEVTCVPDAALGRYARRKASKYYSLCNHAARASGLRVGAPLVVALGTGGCVPTATRDAFCRLLGLDEAHDSVARRAQECVDAYDDAGASLDEGGEPPTSLQTVLTRAIAIARGRVDAPLRSISQRGHERGTRRERWQARKQRQAHELKSDESVDEGRF